MKLSNYFPVPQIKKYHGTKAGARRIDWSVGLLKTGDIPL
jgi:hypothetical protein